LGARCHFDRMGEERLRPSLKRPSSAEDPAQRSRAPAQCAIPSLTLNYRRGAPGGTLTREVAPDKTLAACSSNCRNLKGNTREAL
jgi:hypothetical protein